jgi:hypothetical protein
MPETAHMKHCQNCKAPNPERLTDCYACGHELVILPTYPCLNCHDPIPVGIPECPTCGRDQQAGLVRDERLTPVQAGIHQAAGYVLKAPILTGWEIEPLPDGTVLLKATTQERLSLNGVPSTLMLPMLFVLMCPIFVSVFLPAFRSGQTVGIVTYLPYILSGCLLIGALLLAVFGTTRELRVGKGFLEQRDTILSHVSVRRFDAGGVLRLSHWQDPWWERHPTSGVRLSVQQGKRSTCLASYTHHRGELGLLMPVISNQAGDAVHALAGFLAEVTGWQIVQTI